jgi:hypothetical protein
MPSVPFIWSRKTGAPQASTTDGRNPMVRVGSASHREGRVLGGHERSQGVGCTTGQRTFTTPTCAGRRVRLWVRSHLTAAAPAALANEAGLTEDGPHPAAEAVPSLPGSSHVHPYRPCPGRALSIGRQRSFKDNKGRCVFPPSCRIAPYGTVRGSFSSSRCSYCWAG